MNLQASTDTLKLASDSNIHLVANGTNINKLAAVTVRALSLHPLFSAAQDDCDCFTKKCNWSMTIVNTIVVAKGQLNPLWPLSAEGTKQS